MAHSPSANSSSKGSKPKSKGKGKEPADRSGSSSQKRKSIPRDPYGDSLSNHAGLERFMHEPAYEAAWNPVGATSNTT